MSVYSTKKSKQNVVEESGNFLDLMIENTEDELKMFDSVITLDFLEAYNEAGYNVVTEAEEDQAKENGSKSIKEKIVNALQNFLDNFKKAISGWIKKLSDFFDRDKKMYEQYKEAFNKNAEGKTVKYRPTKSLKDFFDDFNEKYNNDEMKCSEYFTKINEAKSTEEVADILKDIKSYYGEGEGSDHSKESVNAFTGEKSDQYTLTKADVDTIDSIMSNTKWFKQQASTIEKSADAATKKSILDVGKKAVSDLKSEDDRKLELAKDNAKFTAVMRSENYTNKLYHSYTNQMREVISNARSAFLQVVRAKAGEDNNENKETTKAECSLLAIASDIYTESALCFD